MSKLLRLQQRKETIFREMNELRGRLDTNGQFTAEDQAKWSAMDTDYRQVEADVEREREWLDRERQVQRITLEAEQRTQQNMATEQDYDNAFWAYIARGNGGLSDEQRSILRSGYVPERQARGTSTQITTTTTLGGYAVPKGFFGRLIETMSYFGPMLDENLCQYLITDSMNSIEIPTVNDTGTLAEQQTTEGSGLTVADLTLGQKTIGGYTYGTLIKVSEQTMQDELVGLANFIANASAKRIGRRANTHLTTGDASGKPQGIITGAVQGKLAASATAFTLNEVIDLQHSVDPAYRNNPACVFQVHDTIASYLRKMAVGSGDARWLWQPNAQAGQPDLLLGKPVRINNSMDSALTASKKLVLFGDHSQYLVRRVRNFVSKRLDERYADELAIGFVVATRLDGVMLDSAGLKYLQLAAS